MTRTERDALQRAVADYLNSEGCGCCEGLDHEDHLATLAKLLSVAKYPDKSGPNFERYRTLKVPRT